MKRILVILSMMTLVNAHQRTIQIKAIQNLRVRNQFPLLKMSALIPPIQTNTNLIVLPLLVEPEVALVQTL